MHSARTNSSAFTLIELLIVIAVIGILAATSIPVFSSFTTSQRLSQAAKQVKQDLRSAQNRALNGVKDANDYQVWGMSFNGSNSYTIFTCSGLDTTTSPCTCTTPPGQTTFATKSLATGFTISNGLFIFDEISGDICDASSLLGAGASGSVDVTLSGSSRTITVYAGGKIEEN
jgi:prepilin-type N-terminal cleavage/methylation domain-containing protein